MASETQDKKNLLTQMRLLGWDACAVENGASPGTPDTNLCKAGKEVWIELKHVPQWPVKKKTLIKVEHYSLKQKLWALNRMQAGGRVFLLLHIDNFWLLFKGASMFFVGRANAAQLIFYSTYTCVGTQPKWIALSNELLKKYTFKFPKGATHE